MIGKQIKNPRVAVVFLTVLLESLLIFINADEILKFLKESNNAGIPTLLGSIIATPIALLIWSFRNEDKTKDLQQTQENLRHTEENIRQADFHKIEEWATTFPKIKTQESESTDSSKPRTDIENANSGELELGRTKEGALQVAAIYQLLPYLKGEYGDRFVRPTMEIYHSLLSSWQWSEEDKEKIQEQKKFVINKPDYIAALHTIFRQENNFFREFHQKSVCTKNKWIPLKGLDLKSADLPSIMLRDAELSEANLSETNLMKANFIEANLMSANLVRAFLLGADLRGAKLNRADLRKASLLEVDLRGADLTAATYDEEDIKETKMDESTILRDGSQWKPPNGNPNQKSN